MISTLVFPFVIDPSRREVVSIIRWDNSTGFGTTYLMISSVLGDVKKRRLDNSISAYILRDRTLSS